MPPVADYIAIQDSSTTISPGGEGWPGIHAVDFDAPAVHAASRPMLMLRVNPVVGAGQSVRVSAFLNGSEVLDQTFDSDMARAWHEIFDGDILKENDNSLVINVHGTGDVVISDLVLLYKKKS